MSNISNNIVDEKEIHLPHTDHYRNECTRSEDTAHSPLHIHCKGGGILAFWYVLGWLHGNRDDLDYCIQVLSNIHFTGSSAGALAIVCFLYNVPIEEVELQFCYTYDILTSERTLANFREALIYYLINYIRQMSCEPLHILCIVATLYTKRQKVYLYPRSWDQLQSALLCATNINGTTSSCISTIMDSCYVENTMMSRALVWYNNFCCSCQHEMNSPKKYEYTGYLSYTYSSSYKDNRTMSGRTAQHNTQSKNHLNEFKDDSKQDKDISGQDAVKEPLSLHHEDTNVFTIHEDYFSSSNTSTNVSGCTRRDEARAQCNTVVVTMPSRYFWLYAYRIPTIEKCRELYSLGYRRQYTSS